MHYKAGIAASLALSFFSACASQPILEPAPKRYDGNTLLYSSDTSVRYNAVVDINRRRDLNAIDALCALVNSSREDVTVRGIAAYTLGVLGDKKVQGLLIKIAMDKTEEECVRDGAIVGLGKLKEPSSERTLERIAFDASEGITIRKDAVTALKRIEPERYSEIKD